MELLLAEAFKIAVEVHGNQRDKAGEPYMGHICRVMSAMDADEERVVAVLHDAIEDAAKAWGRDVAMGYGYRIYDAYGIEVGDAVMALTYTGITGEPYMNYIRRLATNPLAVKVKLADLRDNMNPKRLDKLALAERERLHRKYHEASYFLCGGVTADLSPAPAQPEK